MNPSIYTTPLSDPAVDDFTHQDGVIDTFPTLDLDLPDTQIIQTLHGRIESSISYWNELTGFNLHDQRIKNLKAFKGDPVRENQLYYQENQWMDNEIFVGVDSIVAYTTAEPSRSEVYPANDSDEAKTYAIDLEKYHQAHSKKFHLAKKTEISVLNLLTQHLGAIGLSWNPNYGKNGEIIPRTINPSHLILDKNFKLGENPEFICEVMKDSLEGLIAKFPDKEQEIMQMFGVKRKGAQNISREIAYREVWFTYYDKKNKPQEAVAWYVGKLVLDKKRNPNWLYGDEGENFLDNPMKPYIFFNLVNDGEHGIDLTGPVAQATSMQETLNQEGQQISQNLQTANGSRVIRSDAMTTDQMENWDQQPNQTVAVELKPGEHISDVVLQLPPQTVSSELVNDVVNSRNAIHGILGTPSQFRGDDNGNDNTASEANMIKNQASGRQDKVIRVIDSAMEDYYNLLTQMMVVHYTETHCRTINGGDGNFDHIEMHRDKILNGATVSVQAGTTLQFDKARQEAVAQNAAELGFLAPYDYFRLMHMDQPQKLYDNLMKFKTDPRQLAIDLFDDNQNKDAIVDFTQLMEGKEVELREDADMSYIEQMRKLLLDEITKPKDKNKYMKLTSKERNNITKFINTTLDSVEVRKELDDLTKQEEEQPTPVPMPQEIQATVPPMMPMMQPQMPMNGMPGGAQPQPMMPQQGMPMQQPQMQPQPMQQMQAPAIPPGIQGIMQQAQQPLGAPNLNPSQPMPPQSVGSLPPM
jgi:hypothetical protein